MFFIKNLSQNNTEHETVLQDQLLATHYLITLTHTTLERLGLFDVLRKKTEPAAIDELSKIIKVRTDILEACINFLWSTTNYLEKNGQKIILKNNPPKWFWIATYKPVFDNLESLLKGTKKYGNDVVRDGYYLQKMSITINNPVENYIVQQLQEIKEKSILVDLGCGPGTLLSRVSAANPLIEGLGIDVDPIITDIAQKNVMRSRRPIKIITADVTKIHFWKKHIPSNVNLIFSANSILHELLRDGEERFISFLKTLKGAFPGSRFFVTEINALSPQEIKNMRSNDYKFFMAMFMFTHPLTEQGLPRSKKEWLSFFKKSQWSVMRTEQPKNNDARIIYDCLL
ncbi:MAG: methyltransferase domain-containing protein [Parcubacteria group bacterium]|nr:methyltransferase domain-containing protein [Parcubacteria group bacterium]